MPWRPEVFVERKWSHNALVFATEQEARENARDLFLRWTLCEDSRAVEVTDAEVNYRYVNGKLEAVEK